MTVRENTAAQRREQTRARLLEAAADAFSEHGFYETRLKDIAARAGFTTGAVYAHFDSKQHIYLELALQRADRIESVAALLADVQSVHTVEDLARASGELIRDDYLDDPRFARLYLDFTAYVSRDPQLLAEYTRRRGQLQTKLSALLASWAERNAVDLLIDADELAALIDVALDGIAFVKATNPGAPDRYQELSELLIGAIYKANTRAK